jgi:hypothetical protein
MESAVNTGVQLQDEVKRARGSDDLAIQYSEF